MGENKLAFDIQRFADTSAGDIAPELVMRAWAKNTWEAGFNKSFFEKFTGTSPSSIIQVNKLSPKKKISSEIFLLLL